MPTPQRKAERSPVRGTRRDLVNVKSQFVHELCFPEAREARSLAIPRQSVTVGGHLRAGEKKTPRRSEAQSCDGIMRIVNLCASGRKPRGLESLVRTEAAMRAAENPMLNT